MVLYIHIIVHVALISSQMKRFYYETSVTKVHSFLYTSESMLRQTKCQIINITFHESNNRLVTQYLKSL